MYLQAKYNLRATFRITVSFLFISFHFINIFFDLFVAHIRIINVVICHMNFPLFPFFCVLNFPKNFYQNWFTPFHTNRMRKSEYSTVRFNVPLSTAVCAETVCCSMITVSHTIPKTVGFYSER